MRVTHVITRLIVGGAQENTVSSVLGLREKPDLEVNLISGPTSGPEGSLEPRFHDRPGALLIAPHLVRPIHPLHDGLALRELTRLLRDQRPDIVHTHSGKAGILGRLAAARAGVPIVIHTIHGPSFGPFQGPISNALFRAAERLAARCTTHFVSVAHAMTRQYLEAGIGRPEQFTRILSGFALEPFLSTPPDAALRQQLGFAPDDFVIGKIARLTALKGHDDLFRIAPQIIRRCPRIRFLLLGDGPARAALQERARREGCEGNFVFAGLIAPEDMPRFISITQAVAHLSYREGLPRALSQALAAAKPVVAYDCDGAGEVCVSGRTGFLIRPGDTHELAGRLVQLAGDPGLCERLGRQGREEVRHAFSVERMVDDLHALYLKLAQNGLRQDRSRPAGPRVPATTP